MADVMYRRAAPRAVPGTARAYPHAGVRRTARGDRAGRAAPPRRADAGPSDPVLASTVFGVRFPGPLGLAAGFDKDGRGLNTLGRARLRLRGGGHGHRPGAARESDSPAVPVAGRPRAAQPDGVQQPRCRRVGTAAGPPLARRPDRGQHRQDQGDPARARRRRLPRQRATARSAGRLPGGQRQLAEHPRSAGPAGGANHCGPSWRRCWPRRRLRCW